MSSRREQQAELRRRMAEARSKLSLHTDDENEKQWNVNHGNKRHRNNNNNNTGLMTIPEQQQQQHHHRVEKFSTTFSEGGEKRSLLVPHPLVPPGGILRKSKYTNMTSSTIAEDGTAKLSLTPSNNLHKESSSTKYGLSHLMADYDDSCSEDENENGHHHDKSNNNNHNNANGEKEVALSSSSSSTSSVENGYASRETQINPPKECNSKVMITPLTTHIIGSDSADIMTSHPRATKVRIIADIVDDSTNNSNKRGLDIIVRSDHQTSTRKYENEKSSDIISDEVWNEFNTLLEEDDVLHDESTKSSSQNHPDGMIPLLDTVENEKAFETIKMKKKKKKKKKSISDINRGMYDNDDTISFEQASYEARIARLVLLKSKKVQQQINGFDGASTGDDKYDTKDALLLTSTSEFYDPGLAFREEDDEKGNTEEVNETEYYPDEDHNDSNVTSSASSLAQILRGRRNEARRISSRGGGPSSDEPPAEEEGDIIDGQWF